MATRIFCVIQKMYETWNCHPQKKGVKYPVSCYSFLLWADLVPNMTVLSKTSWLVNSTFLDETNVKPWGPHLSPSIQAARSVSPNHPRSLLMHERYPHAGVYPGWGHGGRALAANTQIRGPPEVGYCQAKSWDSNNLYNKQQIGLKIVLISTIPMLCSFDLRFFMLGFS